MMESTVFGSIREIRRASWRLRCSARVRLALAALCAGAALCGCGDAESRRARHLENARELIDEGNEVEAAIEYQNVLQLSPDDIDANNALAEIELRAGEYKSAITHIDAAYRADPENHRSALNKARVLVLKVEDLGFAAELIERVIAQAPDSVEAHIVRSNLEIAEGRTRAAMASAMKALALAPRDPKTAWQHGRALQARIGEARLEGMTASSDVYESALAAFEEYIDKGGAGPWDAELEQARVLSVWPRRVAEAAPRYRAAIERAFTDADAEARNRAVRQAIEFARLQRDDELLDWSLSKLLELQPDDVPTWVALASVRKRNGQPADTVLEKMLERLPTHPEAHIEYAKSLISRGSVDEALAYLEKKAADPEQDAPVLLGAIANTQLALHRSADAEVTLQRLERDYPRHPRTILERAQVDLKRGNPGKARSALLALAEHAPSFAVYRLLALAEESFGNLQSAIGAIDRALDLATAFTYDEEMMRVRWLVAQGNWQRVVNHLQRILEVANATTEHRILLAMAWYETDRALQGRALLEQLLTEPGPPTRAVIEYARREGTAEDPAVRARAYAALEALVARVPNHAQALEEITRLDAASGNPARAIARIDALGALFAEQPSLLYMRSQLHASMGQTDAALADARQAFLLAPQIPGGADLLVGLHRARGDDETAMRAAIAASKLGVLGAKGLVDLGNMYRERGANRLALESFQKARAAGADEPTLKNDIAFLLAELKQDLGQALELAKEARAELSNDPNTIDTAGYVYLQSGVPLAALIHFEEAVARAEAPQAGFYYHMGLALRSLDRDPEAKQAFERALSIDSSFPGAANALREMAEEGDTDPS